MVGLGTLSKSKVKQELLAYDALSEEERLRRGREAFKRNLMHKEAQSNAALVIGIIVLVAMFGSFFF